jgi:DNA-directed RNA polymerase subunit M
LEFCPNCKCVLLDDRKKKVLRCRKCNYERASSGKESQRFVENFIRSRETVIVKDGDRQKDTTLPATKAECRKCGNMQAYYWMMQTRGADEPSTRFYRCTKCNYTWREYE